LSAQGNGPETLQAGLLALPPCPAFPPETAVAHGTGQQGITAAGPLRIRTGFTIKDDLHLEDIVQTGN